MNGRSFRRTAAPDFTLMQHFVRCERALHEFKTSAVGSQPDFAALSMNGVFELNVGFCPLLHSTPKWPDLM